MPQTALHGRCHCGNLSLRLDATQPPAQLAARACTCSFCHARHLRWTSDPKGRVEIAIGSEQELSRYRFGTSTADFLICRRCGTVLAAVDDNADPRAVINIDVLDAADRFPAALAKDFDGEPLDTRLARRSRSWTPARVRVGPPPRDRPPEVDRA